jgi:hypothetical protein
MSDRERILLPSIAFSGTRSIKSICLHVRGLERGVVTYGVDCLELNSNAV